ncbi:hypothetical protein B0I00_1886 [Novosphingobium kunmingense]|uniref:HNH endonuclease n=1 Tax=Novosphingobium kunmingense TaxID=1211806 RepID=A0A2N0HL42_9SPHN|nr:HNH endonuclease signature motif containing protein [Novosphingobium kunmingense]PKB19646.1 hypothetical protein B0I00_1886 [Novosphingobium kunmingense]
MVRLVRLAPRLAPMLPRVARAAKVADSFYQSPEWVALRAKRMRDADYREAKARAKPGERLILDHKTERRDGGADLDPANTVWLTFSEHQAKTAQAKAERARRQGGGRKSTRHPAP